MLRWSIVMTRRFIFLQSMWLSSWKITRPDKQTSRFRTFRPSKHLWRAFEQGKKRKAGVQGVQISLGHQSEFGLKPLVLFSVRQVSLSPNFSDLIKVARIIFGHPVVSEKKEKECYSSSVAAAAARKREIFYSIWQWQEPCISHLLKLHSSISSLSFLILLVLYFLVFD